MDRKTVPGGKYDRIAMRALRLVRAGSRPDDAWLTTLTEIYPAEKLESQIKHSCPKWAFCILCHRGLVRQVAPGCCPQSEHSNSAGFTLDALRLLNRNPALARKRKELKQRVFGNKGEPGYRKPNDEVEVLLALREAGEL